jgi:hypothetical protein
VPLLRTMSEGSHQGEACDVACPRAVLGSPRREVTNVALLFTMFLSGVLLYLIGSAMERHERAQRDRERKARWGK